MARLFASSTVCLSLFSLKQLLDSVFVISGKIKVSVSFISLSLWLWPITLTSKTPFNNCLTTLHIMLLSTAGKVLNRIILEGMRDAVDEILR